MKKITLSFLLCSLWALPLWAFDLEVGLQRSKPQIGYHTQTYQGESTNLTFQPDGEETILGRSVTLGIGFENWLIETETATYQTSTLMIDSQGNAVTLYPQFQESRLGVFFRQDRELAGFFLGGGIENYQEQFTYLDSLYKNKGQAPYFKGGLALIFGAVRIRAEQVHSKIGQHNLKTNSIGLLLHF